MIIMLVLGLTMLVVSVVAGTASTIRKAMLVDRKKDEPQYHVSFNAPTIEHIIIDGTYLHQDWSWLQSLPLHLISNNTYTQQQRDDTMDHLFHLYKTCGYHHYVCGGIFLDWSSNDHDYGWLDASICFHGGDSYPYFIKVEVKPSYLVIPMIKNPAKLQEIIQSGRYIIPNFRDKRYFKLLLKPHQTTWMDDEETLKTNNPQIVQNKQENLNEHIEELQLYRLLTDVAYVCNDAINFDIFMNNSISVSASAGDVDVAILEIAVLVTQNIAKKIGGIVIGSAKVLKVITNWIIYIFINSDWNSVNKKNTKWRYFSNGHGDYFALFARYKIRESPFGFCFGCVRYKLKIHIDWNAVRPKNYAVMKLMDKVTKTQAKEQKNSVISVWEQMEEYASVSESSASTSRRPSDNDVQTEYATEPLLAIEI